MRIKENNLKTLKYDLNIKIPCIVLIYFDIEVIQKSIHFLLKSNEKLELIVIENKSEFTDPKIKPFILDLIQQKKISKYILFEENISNNAIEVFLTKNIEYIKKHKYIILTDGDFIVESSDWLTEELSIVEKNSNVFACGISLMMDNLPLKTFPNAKNWVPPIKKEYNDFYEGLTGAHLLLFRTKDLINFLTYMRKKKLKFVDSSLHKYCYKIKKKKWARTKRNYARHLTWDSYNDSEHPYTKLKVSKPIREWWNHDLYCSFKVYTKNDDNT